MSLIYSWHRRVVLALLGAITAVSLGSVWNPVSVLAQQDGRSSTDLVAQNTDRNQTPVTGRDPAATTETFGKALEREYRILIRQETEKYAYLFNRAHYVRKMERAAAGDTVLPEDPASYNIPGALGVALSESRVRLLRALDGNARTRVPGWSAMAQTAYDCWVGRSAIRAGSDDILVCEQQFDIALSWVEAAVVPVQTSDRFNQFLARDYLAYANFEAQEQQDFIDGRHFARKGLRAAQAREIDEVEPEVIARWNLLANEEVPTFVDWRTRLINALQRGRTTRPRTAATAQVMFDCWVERTSERNDEGMIARCRDAFLAALAELEGPEQRPVAGLENEFTVLFDFDKSNIRASERDTIRAAVARAQAINAEQISIVGHTDRAGSERYNLRLSFRRAEAVKSALEAAGISVRITAIFRGEMDPAVPTRDGQREQRNRRAVITIFQ